MSVVLLSCTLYQIKNSCICWLCCHVKDSGGNVTLLYLRSIQPLAQCTLNYGLWGLRWSQLYELIKVQEGALLSGLQNSQIQTMCARMHSWILQYALILLYVLLREIVRMHVCVTNSQKYSHATWMSLSAASGLEWRKSNTTVMLGKDPSHLKWFYCTHGLRNLMSFWSRTAPKKFCQQMRNAWI